MIQAQNVAFYRRAHRMALGCGALHLLVCLGLAPLTGTFGLVALVGVPALLVPAWLARHDPAGLGSRLAVAVGFMFLTALIIQQTDGDIEAHFSFFVMLSILVVYCDWRPIMLAFGVIALHHVGFTWLQQVGSGAVVWGDQRGDWGHVAVHAAVGTVQASALSYLAVMLQRLMQGSFQVNAIAQAISEGRFEPEAVAAQPSPMVAAMEAMRGRLAAMMASVEQAASSLGSALGEIASGSTDLAARTESSAARTQQTTADLQAFVERSRQTLAVTTSAEESNQQLASAVGAVSGSTHQLLATMQQIDGNSRRMSEIIGTIDGIAFQTNILALNAAVEAARAGEQGRGFAVVAGEVRTLAQRSAAAAREVRGLIQAAVDSAGEGNRLAEGTGQALVEMERLITQSQSLMRETADATRDSQHRLEALGGALGEIDGSMQQNAAFVEQLSATTLSLRTQEQGLRQALDSLKA